MTPIVGDVWFVQYESNISSLFFVTELIDQCFKVNIYHFNVNKNTEQFISSTQPHNFLDKCWNSVSRTLISACES